MPCCQYTEVKQDYWRKSQVLKGIILSVGIRNDIIHKIINAKSTIFFPGFNTIELYYLCIITGFETIRANSIRTILSLKNRRTLADVIVIMAAF